AMVQMSQCRCLTQLVQLAVQEIHCDCVELLAVHLRHLRARAYSSYSRSSFCSLSSAYRIRLFTVFSGVPVIRAISAKGTPPIWRSKKTSRWSSGSESTALRMPPRSSLLEAPCSPSRAGLPPSIFSPRLCPLVLVSSRDEWTRCFALRSSSMQRLRVMAKIQVEKRDSCLKSADRLTTLKKASCAIS